MNGSSHFVNVLTLKREQSMRTKNLVRGSFLAICSLFVAFGFADNPIVQTIFTADPAPLVYNDTVYLYTSHDSTIFPDPADDFMMTNWHLFSSTDMANWTDRGSPASLATFKWATGSAWAVQCIYRNGNFYLYCPVSVNGTMEVGVAVSTTPTGPFTDAIGKPLVCCSYDPTVFIDSSSGQAYLYWGGNGPCFYVKLNEDMISYSGSIDTAKALDTVTKRDTVIKPGIVNYQEGPWFYKRNGHYYLAYSATCCPEGIGYCMSDSPTGPWNWKGYIMKPNATTAGNQAGIIDYKGSSYIFYFDTALGPPGGNERRSVCLETFAYNADGTIPTISWTTSGPPQVGNFNPYDTVPAATICREYPAKPATGVNTQPCSDTGGGMDVDSIRNGDWIKVKGVDFGAGALYFMARVASALSGGSIGLHLDSAAGTLVGTCSVPGTGGWQKWVSQSCAVSGATGVHDLYLTFTGGSSNALLFNLHWWQFIPVQTGIYKTGANGLESDRAVKVTVNGGKNQTLRLDFASPVTRGMLLVGLFDLSGRPVRTLFAGPLSSTHLALPLNRAELRIGGYVVKISLDNHTLVKKSVIFN
jgi:hypothetical protein